MIAGEEGAWRRLAPARRFPKGPHLMKSFGLAILLCAISATTFAAEPMMVGVASTEITPPLGYPMSGYFHERGATGTLDPLIAKAIVFRQGDQRVGLLVADILKIDQPLTDAVRSRVAEATGIPEENLIIAATHSHTGPDYRSELRYYRLRQTSTAKDGDESSIKIEYVPHLIERMTEALVEANKATEPMVLHSGTGHEDRVSFNRRFILKDGSVRTWARLSQPDVVKAAGPIDPEIGLISFTSPGEEQPSAAIVNFALHCDTVGGSKFSADFPGHIARVLGKQFGPEFTSVFGTGACGDINHADPTGKPRRSSSEIGEMIAKSALKAWPSLTATDANLGFAAKSLQIPLQPATDEDFAEAEKIIEAGREGKRIPTVRKAWASKIRKLHRMRNGKMVMGRGSDAILSAPEGPRDHILAEVQVIRLSDETALVALPGEIFVDLGLAIKEGSPFENTFIVELANSSPGYVPTRIAYKQGGYEATNSIYAPGGGETLVKTALTLLKELDGEKE